MLRFPSVLRALGLKGIISCL